MSAIITIIIIIIIFIIIIITIFIIMNLMVLTFDLHVLKISLIGGNVDSNKGIIVQVIVMKIGK